MNLIADLIQNYGKVYEATVLKYPNGTFDSIFTFADFKTALSQQRFVSDDIALYKNGEKISDSKLKFDQKNIQDPMVNPLRYSNKKIIALFETEKVGIKINSIYDFSEKINRFRNQLAQTLSCQVSVNSYYSPAQSEKMLPSHRDGYNILILQIHGKKKFFFGKMTDEKLTTDSQTVILSAGEALYLPANLAHFAEPADQSDSLHLTIGLHALMFSDYFNFFTNFSKTWPINLRRPFPMTLAGEVIHEDLSFLVEQLTKNISESLKDKTFLESFIKYNKNRETINN